MGSAAVTFAGVTVLGTGTCDDCLAQRCGALQACSMQRLYWDWAGAACARVRFGYTTHACVHKTHAAAALCISGKHALKPSRMLKSGTKNAPPPMPTALANAPTCSTSTLAHGV
jgi:hypothetical protein